MNTQTTSTKRPQKISTDALFSRIQVEDSFKAKAYAALKEAILKMDLYGNPEPIMLDERELSDRLGVSRTPVREAVAMLEQDGFLRTVPRRGILVVKKNKREIIEMVQAWAALEGMAARLITKGASDKDIKSLRPMFAEFTPPLADRYIERFSGGFQGVDFSRYSKVKNPQLKRYDFGFAQLLEAKP